MKGYCLLLSAALYQLFISLFHIWLSLPNASFPHNHRRTTNCKNTATKSTKDGDTVAPLPLGSFLSFGVLYFGPLVFTNSNSLRGGRFVVRGSTSSSGTIPDPEPLATSSSSTPPAVPPPPPLPSVNLSPEDSRSSPLPSISRKVQH